MSDPVHRSHSSKSARAAQPDSAEESADASPSSRELNELFERLERMFGRPCTPQDRVRLIQRIGSRKPGRREAAAPLPAIRTATVKDINFGPIFPARAAS